MLQAALEEHLVPDADAQNRSPTGQPATDDLGSADAVQSVHARRESADAGDDEAVGGERLLGRSGHGDVGAGRG